MGVALGRKGRPPPLVGQQALGRRPRGGERGSERSQVPSRCAPGRAALLPPSALLGAGGSRGNSEAQSCLWHHWCLTVLRGGPSDRIRPSRSQDLLREKDLGFRVAHLPPVSELVPEVSAGKGWCPGLRGDLCPGLVGWSWKQLPPRAGEKAAAGRRGQRSPA